MNRPTPTEECALDPNIHTYGEYTRCLNSKLENPYEIWYETPKMNIGAIMGFIAAVVIIILIYLSVKAKVNPFDLIMSFFR
jgi:hypothetical protein